MFGIDSYVKLLLHGDGTNGSTTITDSEITPKTVTVIGNAHIDTGYKKFGTGSIVFNGTSDYLTIPDSVNWYFGTNDFTIDTWIKFNPSIYNGGICGQTYFDSDNSWKFYYSYSSPSLSLQFNVCSGGVYTASYSCPGFTPDLNVFYHIELARHGTTMYMFINGVSQSLTVHTAISTNEIPDFAAPLFVGAVGRTPTTYYYMRGWLDEFRISKGIARHTTNFTPPTSPYSLYTQDVSLSDSVTLSDTIARNINLLKTDYLTIGEVRSSTYNKSNSDSVTIGDSYSSGRSLARLFGDTVSLNDNTNLINAGLRFLSFTDGLAFSDRVSRAIGIPVPDVISMSDLVIKDTSINISNTFFCTDLYSPNYTLVVKNYTIEFSVTGSNSSVYVTPNLGGITGTPVYGNGYFTETFVIQSSTPPLSFTGTGITFATITIENTYEEKVYSLATHQTEMNPVWQNLLILYTVLSGLSKDKRSGAAQVVEQIYRNELNYLKQNVLEIIPNAKSDMVFK